MAELSHSSKALDALTLFHRRRFVIFVEGRDDKIFWGTVFQSFGIDDYYIDEIGGAAELDKLAKAIIEDDANIIVARDCDYSDVLGTQLTHKRIIYTYGYSIENSQYAPRSIAATIAIHLRADRPNSRAVERWLREMSESVRPLLVYDLANEKYGRGLSVMGDKCYRFLSKKTAHSFDADKIKSESLSLQRSFNDTEVAEAETILNGCGKDTQYIIRGHFLTHAIVNYIKNVVFSVSQRRLTVPIEAFYAQMFMQLERRCSESLTSDLLYLKSQLDKLGSNT